MSLISLPLTVIAPDPLQPRKKIPEAELAALAASIESKGQLLPIRVRRTDAESDRYVIVSGHRRYAAMQSLRNSTIRCIIIDGELSETDILEEQIAENHHRQNLSPIEEASGYERYLALKNCTATDAAKALCVSSARISRALKLLELPESIRNAVHSGKISADAAYYLGRLPDCPERAALLERAVKGELNRDEAIRAANKAKRESKPNSQSKPTSALSRVSFCLSDETRVSVSGTGIDSVDTLISQLEHLLRAARKALQKGWSVTSLAKVLRDQTRSSAEADNEKSSETPSKGGAE